MIIQQAADFLGKHDNLACLAYKTKTCDPMEKMDERMLAKQISIINTIVVSVLFALRNDTEKKLKPTIQLKT